VKYKEKCVDLRIQLMEYDNAKFELIKIITKMSLGAILTQEDMKMIQSIKEMDIDI